MASSRLLERCSELDVAIKARQQKFGVELYDILAELDMDDDSIPPSSFLHQINDHWMQVNDEILKYHRNVPDKNKRRRKLRVGSISSAMTGQWLLQRKQKFGVACFDTVFDMLGTTGHDGVSLLSKNEKKVFDLIQRTVQDVLELERAKETAVNEEELHMEPQHHSFCGGFSLVWCF